MITSKDAVRILERNGFSIPYSNFGTFRDIKYNGEQVGTLYMDEIFIASEFPHIRNQRYADTKKSMIKLAYSTARSDLEKCIQVLFKSPAAFEAEMRNERVKKIGQYFDSRR